LAWNDVTWHAISFCLDYWIQIHLVALAPSHETWAQTCKMCLFYSKLSPLVFSHAFFIRVFPSMMRFYLSVSIQNFGWGSDCSERKIFCFHKSLLSDFWIVMF
jgi:hypothetical protein